MLFSFCPLGLKFSIGTKAKIEEISVVCLRETFIIGGPYGPPSVNGSCLRKVESE